jgi:ribonuclease HI
LLLIKQFPAADIVKGKYHDAEEEPKKKGKWRPPEPGIAKLNTDGAFTKGVAGTGMVLRDSQGAIIASACRNPTACRDATEAELMAMEEGLLLAMHWTQMLLVIETDCSEACELINDATPNTSIYVFRVTIIHELIMERDIAVIKVSRDANMVSHELAKLGRVYHRNAEWFADHPREAAAAMALDCNPVTI